MTRQRAFDLPPRVSLGHDDFLVSDANRLAYTTVRTAESWPEGKLALVGPAASGKTHLARIFAAAHDAPVLDAGALDTSAPFGGPALVIEGMDAPLPPEAQEWLFHAHNAIARSRGHLLMTARTPPTRWPLTLGDLRSRAEAATVARIDPPDDALLTGVLLKHFADRQITPRPAALGYLVAHMDRSFATARDLVARIDTAALEAGRPVTRDLVRDVLDNPQGSAS